MEDYKKKPHLPIIFIAASIGFIQGLTGFFVNQAWPSHNSVATSFLFEKSFLLAILNFVLAGGLTAQLLLKKSLGRNEALIAFFTGLTFFLISFWTIDQLTTTANHSRYNTTDNLFTLYSFLLILAYVLIPYLQAWHTRKNGKFTYSDLFRHSWDNFFIVAIALLFAGIFWLLISLWAALFSILDIDFFADIFFDDFFAWLATMIVTGIGITIGINNDKIIGALRNIALAICKFLLPLSALITILFTLTLPFVGLQPIWNTNHSSPILLSLIAANVFFINGVVQDTANVDYNIHFKRLVNFSLFLLPVLLIIALYSTWLRIDQHGLSPMRIYSMLIIIVAGCYSFSYPYAVLKSTQSWLDAIKLPNIYTGFLICLLIIASHSPLLNPFQLSASNQYNRLINGSVAVEDFDFGALKYKFGKPGNDYLDKIKHLDKHSQHSEIIEKLELLEQAKSYYDWKSNLQGKKSNSKKIHILNLTDGHKKALPTSFTESLTARDCLDNCYILFLDINSDQQEEILLLHSLRAPYSIDVYQASENTWLKIGRYNRKHRPSHSDNIDDLIRNKQVELVTPEYQNLHIGENQWHFYKNQ